MNGYFLALEGPDGSGKSTIGRLLKEELDKHYDVVLTREPGGTPIGEDIRKLLLSTDNIKMAERTEALLYAASRNQHIKETIKPSLDEGKVVICDRFVFSSLAYQGFARGIGIDKVKAINDFAMEDTYPDRIIFFDVNPEIGLKRNMDEGKNDRLEEEGSKFHQQVYMGYKKAIESYPENIVVIDGERSIEEVLEECLKIVMEDLR